MHEIETHRLYSGGEWKPAADGAEFEVHEPYSGKLMARVASGGQADAVAAIEAAEAAFPAWAALSPTARAALFLKAAALYRERSDEIADILSRETGSTISFALFQQTLVVENLEAAAGWVHQPKGETFPSDVEGRLSMSIRRPLGVVACFTP
jgi:acyl-CoA reductase-like NAD-dependent aldehyde dehydrogenase